ncbi:MAG: hypothetical protein WBP59_10745 [Ilumatobacteraceae bacterium]
MTETPTRVSGWNVDHPSLGFRPRWPERRAHRWVIRLALSLPYIVLAIVANERGIRSSSNQDLEAAANTIDWGSDQLDFVANIYPPVPVAIANLLPSNPVWLGIVGAICGGVVLQVLWERLHQRNVDLWLSVLLLASVGATPAFLYSSTQDLEAFLGMALFALAIAGLLRFTVEGDTEGGFQSGLAFGVAAMCDPATAIYAFFAGIAAPLFASRRYRNEPGAPFATLLVIVVPTVAAFSGWAFLEWRFAGTAFSPLRDAAGFLDFPGGVWDTIVREAGYLLLAVAVMPVFVLTAALMGIRRPIALGAHGLMLLSILITRVVGIHLGSGQGLVIIACVGVLTVGASPSRTVKTLLGLAAVTQVALNWVTIRPGSPIDQFITHLF